MIYAFEVVSPGSDLDGETWDFQAQDLASATARADARLLDTFGWASPERKLVTLIRFVESHPSREAMRRAREAA